MNVSPPIIIARVARSFGNIAESFRSAAAEAQHLVEQLGDDINEYEIREDCRAMGKAALPAGEYTGFLSGRNVQVTLYANAAPVPLFVKGWTLTHQHDDEHAGHPWVLELECYTQSGKDWERLALKFSPGDGAGFMTRALDATRTQHLLKDLKLVRAWVDSEQRTSRIMQRLIVRGRTLEHIPEAQPTS